MTAPDQEERFTLTSRDGYPLAATRFGARAPRLGRLIVAGATGVPQGFYARFAAYAASRGFETLTLDYRGIGRSKRGSLAGFRASYQDWASLDLGAAVGSIPDDELPLFIVAHSFGGHAIGMLPEPERITGAVAFATGAGWHGWMEPVERMRVRLLWNVVLPPIVWWKGYLAWSLLGMGEDLPLDVYRQWRRWCQHPRYFLDDPDATALHAQCARVRFPIFAMTALDDTWAPPRSRDAFLLNAYPRAMIERVDVSPRELGPIGHVGYFRESARPLWDRALDWLETRGLSLSPEEASALATRQASERSS